MFSAAFPLRAPRIFFPDDGNSSVIYLQFHCSFFYNGSSIIYALSVGQNGESFGGNLLFRSLIPGILLERSITVYYACAPTNFVSDNNEIKFGKS